MAAIDKGNRVVGPVLRASGEHRLRHDPAEVSSTLAVYGYYSGYVCEALFCVCMWLCMLCRFEDVLCFGFCMVLTDCSALNFGVSKQFIVEK